jgi:HD-like signal output (HDOD) protein/CheY-like chemotaxis protein
VNHVKNIIFVDDEPHVLDGLRRMLHSYRGEWFMRFAKSGSEALQLLAETPCDVIVTDMRMPGISGADLLAQVSQQYPQTVRIVLSGMCDRDQSLASAVSAHQFLAKPCDPAMLKTAVDRALAMNATLGNTRVKTFISRLKSLPSMPVVYTELVEAARDPDASVRQLGGIVSKDLAMTSKVLHLVNSSLFGLRRPVLDPGEACVYMGIDAIKALVLSLGVFSQYRRTGLFSGEELQRHSLRTAALAKQIAALEHLSQSCIDEVFLAGMLHDVGKLVLAINYPGEYDECAALAKEQEVSIVDLESSAFGITHADAGMYLLRLWGLPEAVTAAVAFHHRPSESSVKTFGPLAIVHAANVLIGEEEHRPTLHLDLEYLSALKLASRLTAWRNLRSEAMDGPPNEQPSPVCG